MLRFAGRYFIYVGLAAAICIATPGKTTLAAEDPAALQKAVELLQASGAQAAFEQLIPRVTQQVGLLAEQINPGEGKQVNELMQTKFLPRILERSHEFTELIAEVYAKHFTMAELDQLIEFYNTPVGRKLVQEQPQMMTEAMGLGQRWGQAVASEVMQEIAPEFDKRGLKMPNI
jgi:uncharacterized protein